MTRPMAQPIASSRIGESGRTVAASRRVSDGTDSPTAVSSRFSVTGLEWIARDLSDNDWAVIGFLTEARLATGHQLARRLWASRVPTDPAARLARRCLARLERDQAIQRLARRMGGVRGGSTSIVYALGQAGRRLLIARGHTPRRLSDIGERYIAHALAVTELVVRLAEADRDGAIEVIEVQTEPACWRGFLAGAGTKVMLKPDLFARIGAGALEDRWFVELDLGTESAATIARKGARYVHYLAEGSEQARHGVFPRIVFTAPNPERLEQLRRALNRVPDAPAGFFSIWPFEETVGRLASEARA
jgi:hypothetical protein